MEIIYLHQYFNTLDMSGSTRSFEMARRLVRNGHIVHVITSDRMGNKCKSSKWIDTEESGIQVHWYPVPYSNSMKYGDRIKAFIKFSYVAAKKAAAIGGDIVFATSTPLTIAIPATYAAKRRKLPMVFEVRDLWPEAPIAVGALKNPLLKMIARHLEQFAYRNANHIVALSPGMKEGIINAGYPEGNITVIPNCCDLDLFNVNAKQAEDLRAKHEWLRNRPLIIYAGAIGFVNGVDYFARLAAATYSLDEGIRFLVIGTGSEENSVRQLAENLGILEKNFFMMPQVPKYIVPVWLAAADIATSLFINIPVAWTNSANKFFDALAAGKPIAINYGGWQADLICEAGAGLILHPSNVQRSAKLLIDSINNRIWLSSAGRASKKLAEEYFDRDKLAREFEKVLRREVDERQSVQLEENE